VTLLQSLDIRQLSDETQDDLADIAKPLPSGKKGKDAAASTAADDLSDISHPVELTEQTGTEGMYEMSAPHGGKIKIPYSKIGDAAKSGYKMTDTDRKRYLTDAAADKSLNDGKNLPEGVQVIGKNSAGQDIVAPTGVPKESILSSEVDALGNAAKGLVKFIDPRRSEEEKKRDQTSGTVASTFDILMQYPERAIQPNVDMATQSTQEAEDAARIWDKEKGIAKLSGYTSAAEHGLASAIPLVGPFAASVIDQAGAKIAQRNYTGAAGSVLGNAMVAEAPGMLGKVGKGVATSLPKTASSFVESVTKTGPREVKALAEHTEKENAVAAKVAEDKNAANAETHLNKTIDAVQEANKHANKEGFRNEELEKQNEQKRQEFNKKELERVKSEGEARLDALKKNKDKVADYEERREAIKKQNEANYRREIRQQNLQEKLKAATGKLDTLYQKTFKDATKSYNTTWNKWRDQVKNATANMTSTVDVIKAQEASMNPQAVTQFREILRESSPDEDALTGVERRDQFSQQAFKESYDKLNPDQKAVIDKDVAERGLDLTDQGLKEVPASRLHGWKSQLERAVRTTQDGTIRYAIGQVLDQLRKTEGDVSASVGPDAVKQLSKARAITGPYFDAFFKSPDELPRAAGQSLREQNPEYVKEKGAQQRLERIAKYNPEVGTASKLVANLTQGLEDIAREKNIGKRSELPIKPDTAPVPTVTPAGQFQPKEFNPTPGAKNTVVPDRPPEEIAAEKRLSPEDYKKWKAENVAKTSQRIRDLAISRAMYAGMTAIPVSIASFALGHPGAAALEISTPFAVVEFSNAVANLLEKPGVVEYLSRITDKDVAAFEKLPPKQKALFKEDMSALTKEAKKQGVTISPVFDKFLKTATVAGSTTERKKKLTPQELLQQAHNNLQSGFYQSGFGGIPPNAGTRYTYTAVNGDGHTVGSNSGTEWFDVQTGQPVQ
jgi:hypothetical protein